MNSVPPPTAGRASGQRLGRENAIRVPLAITFTPIDTSTRRRSVSTAGRPSAKPDLDQPPDLRTEGRVGECQIDDCPKGEVVGLGNSRVDPVVREGSTAGEGLGEIAGAVHLASTAADTAASPPSPNTSTCADEAKDLAESKKSLATAVADVIDGLILVLPSQYQCFVDESQ